MNKSTGNFTPDRWELTFVGGPMDGKTITHPVLPERFAKREGYLDKATGRKITTSDPFYYVPTEVDEAKGTARMVLG